MDDSFKKLNGPSADGIQSDYLAKEKRAAEELLNLQLGNARKLADLRSKLLSKLVDEAKEEGKLVEDYLAEYGLQKRLDALATELDAEKKARAGQLDELQAIRQENADVLAATEEKVAKLRATQQAKEAAARKAANQAQHKAELAALKELEKARKNLTVPSANAEVSVDPIEPIDVQARVETELDIDSTVLENLSAEAVVTPKVSEITLPQTELEVAPKISDITLSQAELEVTPRVSEISLPQAELEVTPKVSEITLPQTELGVTPRVSEITLPQAELEVTPQVSDINLSPVDITARLADLNVPDTEVKVVPEVEDINIPKTDLEVTPHLKELTIPGAEVQVDPKLTVESVTPSIDLPNSHDLAIKAKVEFDPELPTELGIVAHISAEDPTVGPISVDANVNPQITTLPNVPELNSQLNLAPVVQPIPELTTDIKIKPVVNPVEDQVANLKLTTIVDKVQDQEANLKLAASIDKIPSQEADLTLHPVVDPLPDLTSKLLLTPTISSEIADQQASLELTPKVPSIKVEPIEADVKLRTKSEDLQSLKASAQVTPEVGKIQDLEANATLNLDTSALEGLETTVTAKVETDGSVIVPSLDVDAGAEAGLAKSRLAGVQQVHTSEADLIAFRQKSEEELSARRISSLDLLQDTFHNLYSLIPTEIKGPEGPIELPTDAFDAFVDELESAIAELQRLFKEDFSLHIAPLPTALPSKEKKPTATSSSSQDKESDEYVDRKSSLNTAAIQFAKLKKDIDSSFGPEKIAPLFETLSVKIEEADQKVKATNKALAKALKEGDKQAIASAKAEKELAESTALDVYKTATALAKRLDEANKSKAVKETDIQRAAQDEKAIIALTHDAEMHKLHIEAVRARYQAENELYRLSLITDADIAQQYEDEKAKKSEDAITALAKKKQELARANLAANDKEYLEKEALAELEAARIDKEIKAANAKVEKQKQQIKYEQNLIAIRLEGLKNNKRLPDEYKDLATDPAAVQTEIEKRLSQVNPVALQTAYNEQSLTEADQAKAEAEAVDSAKAEAEKNGTAFDEEAVRAQVAEKFRLDRELAAKALAEDQEGLEELFGLRTAQEKAIQSAKDDAAKKARKETEKEDEKGFKAWTKKFIELNKRKGKLGQLAGAAADLGSFASGSIKGDIEARKAELEAEGKSEAEIKETLQKETQAKLDGALNAVGDFINQLATIGKSSAKHQSGVDTRLQGLTTDENKGGINKSAGSYWRSLAGDIGKLGASPFFKQEEAEERFDKLISQGIAFNVKERAFLDVLKDKVATTFNVADGTLLKLVRIQQADTSAARLGMESALTEFLNSMYATTEYMQQAAESIRSNLYEATALMGAKEATEFEFQVQKWMGSLYSVGFSNTEGLSAALGKIVAGEIEGITEGSMGNLLVMAANEAGKPIANILEKGLSASDADDLMKSMVEYLAKLYNETKGSKVLAQQFANVFGLTASDLKAAANLAPSITEIAKQDETFSSLIQQVYDLTGSMVARTSIGEMGENMKANFMYSMASSLANDPFSSFMNMAANMLNDLVGGIEIPFVNVFGFGFDLNATVADLMNVAALVGPTLSGIGKMAAGLANLAPSNLLKTFGVDKGDAGLNVQTRGTTSGLAAGTAGGGGTSESAFVGNENASDIKNKTVSDASEEPSSTVAEAKDDRESKEEARSQMIAGHIVDIYELLQEVTSGTKKFRVQLDVGTNPLTWAGGTWT
jgi:hypothetical protein